jgi:hypothetical protein
MVIVQSTVILKPWYEVSDQQGDETDPPTPSGLPIVRSALVKLFETFAIIPPNEALTITISPAVPPVIVNPEYDVTQLPLVRVILYGVAVLVGVEVGRLVSVGVLVDVPVTVGVLVKVGVNVGVFVGVAVNVGVNVGVETGVPVGVVVGVGVGRGK